MVIYRTCGKAVCKRLCPDSFYICNMYFNRSVISKVEFYGYKYCNYIHSGGFAYFNCDRWIFLQHSRIYFKRILVLFFLTEPRMSFQTYAVGYPVTFLIMLISSVLTGTLAAKLKTHAKLSAQLAFRTQVLFETDRLLQREKEKRRSLGLPVHS